MEKHGVCHGENEEPITNIKEAAERPNSLSCGEDALSRLANQASDAFNRKAQKVAGERPDLRASFLNAWRR